MTMHVPQNPKDFAASPLFQIVARSARLYVGAMVGEKASVDARMEKDVVVITVGGVHDRMTLHDLFDQISLLSRAERSSATLDGDHMRVTLKPADFVTAFMPAAYR